MPYFIALVGFMVLSGGGVPITLPDTTATTTVAAKIAMADPVEVTRPETPESYTVKLTSYNAVAGQTDDTPFTTSIGAHSNPEVVAARSGDLAKKLPYGTVIAVYGPENGDTPSCNYSKVEHLIGLRVVADAMNSRITNTIDILFDEDDTVTVSGRDMNPSRALGLCHGITVKVIGRIDPKDIPDTQEQLVKIVKAGQLALAY